MIELSPAILAEIEARPSGACILHPSPAPGGAYTAADPGYVTCSPCVGWLRERLAEIETRYRVLDPTKGTGDRATRSAPGFASRSPGSDHLIALRDLRTSRTAKVWVGGDGRVHREDTHGAPISVLGELETCAVIVAEACGMAVPRSAVTVGGLVRWLDVALDRATRDRTCVEVAATVRVLLGVLRPVSGAPRPRYIGNCPQVTDWAPDLGYLPAYAEDPGVPVAVCSARLYAPLRGDTIECRECGTRWPRETWMALGQRLTDQSAKIKAAV